MFCLPFQNTTRLYLHNYERDTNRYWRAAYLLHSYYSTTVKGRQTQRLTVEAP